MPTQKSRALVIMTTKQPRTVSVPDLELQTNRTPHEPAQRHDGSSKCAPVHKGRLFRRLMHEDSPQEPRDRNATRKVALRGGVRVDGCNGLEDEPRNERSGVILVGPVNNNNNLQAKKYECLGPDPCRLSQCIYTKSLKGGAEDQA